MKKLFFVVFLFLIATQYSCKKEMEQRSIEQTLGEFDTLVLNSVFHVFMIQGTENSIKLEAANKIIKEVSISIDNNNLILQNNYKGNWLHPQQNKIKVYVTTNGLRRIIANETCDINTVNALVADVISLEIYGKLSNANLEMNCNYFLFDNAFPSGGKITLSGSTDDLRIINAGLMAVDAKAFTANNVYIENSSKGKCEVTSQKTFTYQITGEGDILLNGKPSKIINKGQSASGKLLLQ